MCEVIDKASARLAELLMMCNVATAERDAAIKRAEAAEAEAAVLLSRILEVDREVGEWDCSGPNDECITISDLLMTDALVVPQAQALLDRVRGMEDALRPFADAFSKARESYVRRYADREIGHINFDKMPDEWSMEYLVFTMGDLRRAASALSKSAAGV